MKLTVTKKSLPITPIDTGVQTDLQTIRIELISARICYSRYALRTRPSKHNDICIEIN